MPLSPGARLGPYEILAPLGEGGMGEVYRARDAKLKRDVALKVLPEAFARDPERLARFQREAKVVASLNHPNIAAIYGIEQDTLVMELVEGESPKGPLPFDEAWHVASQIAAALEYAHDKGIIHRDLKPANVKITPDGAVKLLDFGLAKAFTNQREVPAAAGENSPTLTIGATEAGVVLGTAAYMAPEQAKGKIVDRRADIWAFGVVLYELLTGERPFKGDDVSETLVSVLRDEPDLAGVPPKARKLLRRCLEKDPKKRLRDIGEASYLLDDAAADAIPTKRSKLPWVVAGALALLCIAGWAAYLRATRPVDHPLMRLSLDLGPDAIAGQFTTVAISPDGTRLVFPFMASDGRQMLATRLLSETKSAALPGTDHGRDPFFSPDGQWIGFFADGKMKKSPVQGGAPVVLCDAFDERGGSWGEDDVIYAALNSGGTLSRVPAEGGAPQQATKVKGSLTNHRWPQALPGGKVVLFTASSSRASFEDGGVEAVSIKTGEIKILVLGGYFGRYVPSGNATGHLLYSHEGVLFAVPFDPIHVELLGPAVPLLDDVMADPTSGAGQFSFSEGTSGPGILAYRAGKLSAQGWPVSWLDNQRNLQPLITTLGFFMEPRSPDGHRLALMQAAGNSRGIFVYDLQRDAMSRLVPPTSRATSYPTWTPDGKHIVFRITSVAGTSLGWIRADGAGEIQDLLDRPDSVNPYSFFPDGRRLAYYENDSDSSFDLWTLSLDTSDPDHPKPGKPELFLRTPADERFPAVSPDGRWIAYKSDESGRDEVYVRPFPGPGGKSQISSSGGTHPVWSSNGKELFFENLENRIMVTEYALKSDSVVPGKPRLWSDQQLHDLGGPLNYALAPDGKRFAILPELKTPDQEKGTVHITFLINFFDELRRRAPVTK